MGCWGVKSWENDGAADWFGDLWDEFPVPQKVEETLKLDVHDFHEEIRAAVYVLLQFGDVYRWPVADIDKHCELAAKRLEEMLQSEIYEDEEFRNQIRQEIEILRSRVSKDGKA
jgi:hypothetical protein